MKTSSFRILLAGSAIAVAATTLSADTITLKDGTVLEGTVIEQGDKYWVKTDKGSKFIAKTDVASINDGSADAKGGAGGDTGPASTNADFLAAKHRADAVETPIAGVTIWQEFIDNTTDPDLLASAQTEMKHWQELTDNEAEKIKGVWVGGDERKKIVDQAEGLNREAWEMLRTDQTMGAIAKLEESARIYPNSFKNNFLLGYVALLQDQNDKAITYFTQTLRLQPNSAAAMSNLGVAYAFKRQFDKAITYMHKAVQIEDSDEISKNLITAMQVAPPAVVRSPRLKEARSTAILMARTKGMDNSKRFFIVPMKEEIAKADEAVVAGMVSSGTGFLINTEGLIITNAHVVAGGKTFMVLINNAERRSAEVLHVDEAMDLAIIRVKPKEGETLPFLQFMAGDHPGDGAECTVMGYPMIDRLGAAIKITRGIVSSGNTTVSAGADVLIDAKVNPGNSGGPILDRFGQVMAVVCMKSFSTATEDSYGIGISAGNVRKFLVANKITIEPGAASTTPLTTEEVATQAKGATVCIIATR